MAQPLSIEDPSYWNLITCRTAGSKLWLINNRELQERILGCLARYQWKYGVLIYCFILMGNHYHLLAKFPQGNRAHFMRDFNSAVARLVGRYCKVHGRRSVWARRYSYQVMARPEDVHHWFYYVCLNPVSSGIVSDIREYPSYNSYFDALNDVTKTYKWIDWSKYLMKKRYHPTLKPSDFTQEYSLQFSRLPATGELTQPQYKSQFETELFLRQQKLVSEIKLLGKGFLGLQKYRSQAPGTTPRQTKTSHRRSFRPLILTLCTETKKLYLALYFQIKEVYEAASIAFRKKEEGFPFPKGTYPPPILNIYLS